MCTIITIAMFLCPTSSEIAADAPTVQEKEKQGFNADAAANRLEMLRVERLKRRDELMAAALDVNSSVSSRLSAFHLLSQYDDAETIRFLLIHRLVVVERGGAINSALVFPCLGALQYSYVGNWKAARHAVQCIDLMSDIGSYRSLASILGEMVGAQNALAMIDNELALRPNASQKKKLENLREQLFAVSPELYR